MADVDGRNDRPATRARSGGRRVQKAREAIITALLAAAGLLSVAITLAIIGVLAGETVRFFRHGEATVGQFLLSARWNPLLGPEKQFGVWPLVIGTFQVTAVAMAFALPVGLITAIYTSEYAPRRLRDWLKPALELLAGIPTVVFGFFALTVLTPALQWFGEFSVYNAMSAGIAVGILCLPMVSSLCEDALRAVPQALRDGALGLGATRFDTSIRVVVPAALSGIISAFLLAVSRAVGETMVVALAAGNRPRNWSDGVSFLEYAAQAADLRQDTQTMTGYMVQMALGDVSNFGIEYLSMYAVAATLFVITFSLTFFGQVVRRRYHQSV